ncbi:helix-turn-helix domain-containing protein [Peptacetobacter hiranonis]|uniref:helix-turn-helix domain-containing protein n=1 Tax=Peptacetobacter hiranonis TaxID=89152 RepID=UPI003D81752C
MNKEELKIIQPEKIEYNMTIDYNELNEYEQIVFAGLLLASEKEILELLEIGSFAYCIKNIRKLKKITQKQLAEILNISENTIYNYESGKNKPNNSNREKIMNFLEIREEFILEVDEFYHEYLEEFELGKKEIEKDNKLIDKIVEELKKDNSIELRTIVLEVVKRRLLKLDGIYSVINGYRMLCSNIDIQIKQINMNNNSVAIYSKIEKCTIFMKFEDFIFSFLIQISENAKNIFENNRYKEKNLFQNEMNKKLSEQYKKILDSLEGDNNE